MLVKISEANNHKISINDINQIISEAINSDVLPGYIITFLQCLIYNRLHLQENNCLCEVD